MLTMVIAKPMQLTMVSDVPLDSAGALCATIVENSGESAMTETPQTNRKANSKGTEAVMKKGESMQQAPEMNNAIVAIFFAPYLLDNVPLRTHAGAPDAITKNEIREVSRSCPDKLLKLVMITGRKAQNVYNSHMCPK